MNLQSLQDRIVRAHEKFGLYVTLVFRKEVAPAPDPTTEDDDIYHETLPTDKTYRYYAVQGKAVVLPLENIYKPYGSQIERDLDLYYYTPVRRIQPPVEGERVVYVDPEETYTVQENDSVLFRGDTYDIIQVAPVNPTTTLTGADTQFGWHLMARKHK